MMQMGSCSFFKSQVRRKRGQNSSPRNSRQLFQIPPIFAWHPSTVPQQPFGMSGMDWAASVMDKEALKAETKNTAASGGGTWTLSNVQGQQGWWLPHKNIPKSMRQQLELPLKTWRPPSKHASTAWPRWLLFVKKTVCCRRRRPEGKKERQMALCSDSQI